MNHFGSFEVIESAGCLRNYQLTDLVADLMGPEWVKQFDEWAASALPKQPACYMLGNNTMFAHPTIVLELRKASTSELRIANTLGLYSNANYAMTQGLA